MDVHKADAKAMLDDRGYSGPTIRGQNPALLFEKAVRDRITESFYWKEQCFGLNAASLCDRAAELKFIGGTYGGVGRPTPFLCLAFKLLQLVPEKEVILEYLNFSDDAEGDAEESDGENFLSKDIDQTKKGEFKYLRALAAFYIRLAWDTVEIYQTLEPLLADYRKLKRRTREGFVVTYMDQFIDDLLTKDRVCATSLWKLTGRSQLEDLDVLEPRESALGEELEELDRDDEMEEDRELNGNGSDEEGRNGRGRSVTSTRYSDEHD